GAVRCRGTIPWRRREASRRVRLGGGAGQALVPVDAVRRAARAGSGHRSGSSGRAPARATERPRPRDLHGQRTADLEWAVRHAGHRAPDAAAQPHRPTGAGGCMAGAAGSDHRAARRRPRVVDPRSGGPGPRSRDPRLRPSRGSRLRARRAAPRVRLPRRRGTPRRLRLRGRRRTRRPDRGHRPQAAGPGAWPPAADGRAARRLVRLAARRRGRGDPGRDPGRAPDRGLPDPRRLVAALRRLHQICTNVTGPHLIGLVLASGASVSLTSILTVLRAPEAPMRSPVETGFPAGLSAANGYGVVDTRRAVLVLNDVTKTYPNGRDALKDVDLVVPEGDFVFLVGASGAGKSTLMKLLIRDELATQGTVILDGDDMSRLPRRKVPIVRRKIGIVFQDFKLLPRKTVRENIAFALEVTGTPRRRIRPAVDRALALVGLTAQAAQYPKQLSG